VGRRLGQHFLASKSILERIARAACPEREPLVIEIGAGRGALTRFLVERAERVIAIETDPRLAERLAERFAGAPNLTLVRADVLKTDLGQWGPAVVAGNLPYYITSPILNKVLALGPLLRRAVFLVQKEVAERLTAAPGGRDYGFVTVRTALVTKPELLFAVKPSAFRPPPKVDSAVVKLEMRAPEERAQVDDPAAFLEFAARCFHQKRKTIRNNLAAVYPRALLDACPETGRRAEQLSLEELAALFGRLRTRSPESLSPPEPG